jgi:nucleoside-diphosphate-sugar epimerase
MDALVVGCGYLGTRVAALWRAEGRRVFATTRGRADELRRLGVEPVVCDLVTGTGLGALPAVATVAYCVGFDRGPGLTMRDVYVRGLENVLARLPAPARFVYVSSTGVYGQTGGEEVDETAATEPAEESGRVVLEAETLLRSHLPGAIVLRFAGIYGAGRLLRRQAIERGEPLVGDSEKWLNLIHVDDGAAAVVLAAAQGTPGGVYNVCDHRPVRRREFYAELSRALGAPPPRFVSPAPGGPPPPHERANRRIVNRKLALALCYPTFIEGLKSCVTAPSSAQAGGASG